MIAEPAGCQIHIRGSEAPRFDPRPFQQVFRGEYGGTLPRSAKDPELPAWLARVHRKVSDRSESARYAVRLAFGGRSINLGDIATGPVKSLIDCLHPILGGTQWTPADWKVSILQVEKGTSDAASGEVAIEVWEHASP